MTHIGVHHTTPNPKANIKTWKEPLFEQTKLCQKIKDIRNQRALITQHTHMQLRQQEQCEWIQLVRNNDTGEYLNYRQLIRDPKHQQIWNTSAANECGWLAQGVGGRVKVTNTIFFIPKDKVPKDRMKDVTYGSFSCDLKPNKAETYQTRLTSGRDRINHPKDVGSLTADMTLVRILLNRVISTKGAKCVMLDIKKITSTLGWMIQVHAPETLRHPQGNTKWIQIAWDCNIGRICILQNQKGSVRPTSSGNNSTRTPAGTPC